jgi:hypothetical protein
MRRHLKSDTSQPFIRSPLIPFIVLYCVVLHHDPATSAGRRTGEGGGRERPEFDFDSKFTRGVEEDERRR